MKYFSREFENELVTHVRPFGNVPARLVDAKSVANIIRLVRRAPQSNNLFRSDVTFLTHNTGLVTNGMEYLLKSKLIRPEDAPPIISDWQMAGLLWLALGGSGSDIPRKTLIANCLVDRI
jgi:hypothetical protein